MIVTGGIRARPSDAGVGAGDRPRIGDAWLQREADRHGGRVGPAGGGLLPDTAALDGPGFAAAALHPAVREFYEDTAAWRMDVWAQWSSVAWPGGWLVSALFARRLGQLSLPLRPVDVAHGMSKRGRPGRRRRRRGRRHVLAPHAAQHRRHRLRRLVRGGRPARRARRARVLPPARRRLVVQPAGHDRGWARRIPVHERFHVHVDAEGVLRTDHDLRLWSVPVLRLHYRLIRS